MVRIFNNYFNLRSAFFFVTEGVLIFSSVGFAIVVRFLFDKDRLLKDPLVFFKSLVFAMVCQLCFTYSDLYTFKNGKYNQNLVRRLLQSILAAAVLLSVISYVFPVLLIGRGVFTISLVICPFLILIWRYLYIRLLDTSLLNNRVIIFGSGSLALDIGKEILARRSLGYNIVGFIAEDSKQMISSDLNSSIIGDSLQLPFLANRERVSRIIVALSERRGSLPVKLLLDCKMLGIDVEDGLSFYEKMTGKVSLDELKLSWLVFSDGFIIQKQQKALKRLIDILLSSLGLFLAIPFFIVVPLAIRLDSRGPIFYRQNRVGENEKNITILKFRSMRNNAEEENGAVWAQPNDSRVTRVGNFIRRTRIDELPQLISVLKGEMSFVGPRPERPEFVQQFKEEIPYYSLRYSVKPGITGWAQVKYQYGASKEETCEKLKYDLYYIKNLSIFLDFSIIFYTVKVVLLARGSR